MPSKKEDKVADGGTNPEGTDAETTETPVDWQAEAQRLQGELEKEASNRKSLQANLSDREAKLRDAQDIRSEFGRMRSDLEELKVIRDYTEYMAKQRTDDFDEAELTPRRAVPLTFESFSAKRNEERRKADGEVEKQRVAQENQQLWQNILSEAQAVGVDTNAPEFQEGMRKTRNYAESLAMLPLIKTKQDAKKSADELKKQAEIEADAKKKEVANKGLLDVDASIPSAGGRMLTIADIRKMSPEEQVARRDEIAKVPLGI